MAKNWDNVESGEIIFGTTKDYNAIFSNVVKQGNVNKSKGYITNGISRLFYYPKLFKNTKN